MIQDIFPHQFDNHYQANQTIGENDYVFHFNQNTVLLKQDGETLYIPQKKDFATINAKSRYTFLFTLNAVSCFMLWDDLPYNETQYSYKEISFFRNSTQADVAWSCIAAYHLYSWYNTAAFCGKCGTATHHKEDERAMQCPHCNTVIYPRISPAIIVAILCNDKILLARNANFTGRWYALIAGFVDIGETLEEAVKREVKEEVGLDVFNIRYYKSQPWPLTASMMMGFVAEAHHTQAIAIDEKEIAEAAWFSRDNLPEHPTTISIAGEMIEKFVLGQL